MRLCLVVCAVLLFGAEAEAQQLAEVRTVAHVRIPDFLILETGSVIEQTLPDGKQVRRVTLLVTANRAWTLEVARSCGSSCSDAEYSVSGVTGKAGSAQKVVVEYVWSRGEQPPSINEFEYLLVGA
jgi:hypothetical protein